MGGGIRRRKQGRLFDTVVSRPDTAIIRNAFGRARRPPFHLLHDGTAAPEQRDGEPAAFQVSRLVPQPHHASGRIGCVQSGCRRQRHLHAGPIWERRAAVRSGRARSGTRNPVHSRRRHDLRGHPAADHALRYGLRLFQRRKTGGTDRAGIGTGLYARRQSRLAPADARRRIYYRFSRRRVRILGPNPGDDGAFRSPWHRASDHPPHPSPALQYLGRARCGWYGTGTTLHAAGVSRASLRAGDDHPPRIRRLLALRRQSRERATGATGDPALAARIISLSGRRRRDRQMAASHARLRRREHNS